MSTATPRPKNAPPAAAIDNKATVKYPLDFSFKALAELADLETELPRPSGKRVQEKNDDGKFDATAISLYKNNFQNVGNLRTVAEKILIDPDALTWIDLTLNELTKIDPVFCEFPNLKILLLPGNQINDLREVDKLGDCPSLVKLALHGNPIETEKMYRPYILSRVTQLRNFDMSGVTKADRSTAEAMKNVTVAKKKKKKAATEY